MLSQTLQPFWTPGWFTLAAGLLSLVIGSFLNVVIYRLPLMIEREFKQSYQAMAGTPDTSSTGESYNLVVPRSRCPNCQQPITALQNIPLVSWLVLRGRCARCHAKISVRYPLIELLTAAFGVGVALHFGPTPSALAALLLTWFLIPLAAIDFEHYLLPDKLTLPLLWIGLLINSAHTFVSLESAVFGATAGYLAFRLVYEGFRLVTGKEGLGAGDFKLLAALGAWLGWQMLPLIVLLAAVTGVIGGTLWLLAQRKGREHPIPFGPFIVAAGWIALMWGPAIISTYLRWVSPPV